jgi:asparagine synthase (glutamine-hydrolysing)
MCGIAGIYHFKTGISVDQHLLKRMCDVLRHRGPDGEGVYLNGGVGLGHRRLSIIDLDTGQQPMSNEDETIWIVFNGEIFNYIELASDLRSRGHQFRSQSDTEVILHLYEERGPDCLEDLLGMFAFALWDSPRKRLFVARDRLGIKPLYYYLDDKRFVFASEAKAILEDKSIDRQPYYPAISDYLRYMYTIDDSTFFKGIKKLLPGYYLVLEDGHFSIRQYWDLKFNEDEEKSEEYYVDKFLDLLKDSLRIHLRSDVPLGSHLSGGLDTSCLVGLASQMLPHTLKTFSGAYNEPGPYNEREYINIVADKFQTEHYEIIPSASDYAEALNKIIWQLDEPSVGSAVIGQYYVCKLASEHVKVILGGQGGDELFGGYYRYIPSYLKNYLRRFFAGKVNPIEISKTLVNLVKHIGIIGLNNTYQKAKRRKGILEITTDKFNDEIGIVEKSPNIHNIAMDSIADSFNKMQYWDIKNYLPALLHIEDRTSMAVSIESRVPFLDHRIVEFSATIPPYLKMKGLVLKYIEREAGKRFLPPEVVNRKDKGIFSPPIQLWFKKDFFPIIQDIFHSQVFRERGIFNVSSLEKKINYFRSGKIDYSEQLWMVLNVELWHQLFIDQR